MMERRLEKNTVIMPRRYLAPWSNRTFVNLEEQCHVVILACSEPGSLMMLGISFLCKQS